MAFALAVTHPEALAAAFPISGMLPPSLYPSAALRSAPRPATLPRVEADLAAPTRGAPRSLTCGALVTPQSCASTRGSSTRPPTRKWETSWSASGVPLTASSLQRLKRALVESGVARKRPARPRWRRPLFFRLAQSLRWTTRWVVTTNPLASRRKMTASSTAST